MITRLIILAILSLSVLSASSFGTSIEADAIACGLNNFGPVQPPLLVGAHTSTSGPCAVGLHTVFASATAGVDPSGVSGSEINGSATTQWIADAISAAKYFDTVTLVSPQINYTGGVSITAGDNYSLSMSGTGSSSAVGVALGILAINGAPAPSSYVDAKDLTGPGSASGQLSIDFTILACPCSFEFLINGSAVLGPTDDTGANASFKDPFSLTLPPGWTYTLASQQTSAVPEPASVGFAIAGLGLMAGAMARRFQKAATIYRP